LSIFAQTGVYRQTTLGNLGLVAAVVSGVILTDADPGVWRAREPQPLMNAGSIEPARFQRSQSSTASGSPRRRRKPRTHPWTVRQEVSLPAFRVLEAGDIVFVDSPHVAFRDPVAPARVVDIRDMFDRLSRPRIVDQTVHERAYAATTFLSQNNAWGIIPFSDDLAELGEE
jgi:hypothetical protein